MSTPSPSLDKALRLATTDFGLDRLAEHRADPSWLEQAWTGNDARGLLVTNGRAAVEEDGTLAWRPTNEMPEGDRFLLGAGADQVIRFAVRVDEFPDQVDGSGLRALAPTLAGDELALALHAIGLANWHAAHRHCPRCGARTESAQAGAERRCTADDSAHFPRTDPAVIVLVTDSGGRALLGHHRDWPPGRFSTLAGFVEPGESAEQAVAREVREESQIVITKTHYLGSQPWPFPSSLMLGFEAEAVDAQPVPDGTEMAEVRWFAREEFTRQVSSGEVVPPSGISIAHALVERWFGSPLPDGPAGMVWR